MTLILGPLRRAVVDFEIEHDFPDIGWKAMLLNARRLQQEGGEQIPLAIEDVTDRWRAEMERQEIEIRFTSLVKNVKDHSIFTLDPEGRVTGWNVAAEHILGYSEAEVLGRHFSFIFTSEDYRQGMPEAELRAAREVGRAEDERWHLRKSGHRGRMRVRCRADSRPKFITVRRQGSRMGVCRYAANGASRTLGRGVHGSRRSVSCLTTP